MDIQLFQHLSWKGNLVSLKMLIVLCQRSVDCIWVVMSGLLILSDFLYIPLETPCNDVGKPVHFCNEIPFHGYHKHLFRVGRPLCGFWVHLLRWVDLDYLPWLPKFQDLVFQTRKQDARSHLFPHQFTFLWEVLSVSVGDLPSFLSPCAQQSLRQLQAPVGILALSGVSCSRQSIFRRGKTGKLAQAVISLPFRSHDWNQHIRK